MINIYDLRIGQAASCMLDNGAIIVGNIVAIIQTKSNKKDLVVILDPKSELGHEVPITAITLIN